MTTTTFFTHSTQGQLTGTKLTSTRSFSRFSLLGRYAVLLLSFCFTLIQPVTAETTIRQQGIARLQSLQARGIMFGHQDDPFYGVSWAWDKGRSDVLEVAGDYPAVMGFELGGIEMADEKNLDSVPFTRIREELLAHVKRGGVVTISWHPRNPLTGGTSWDVSDTTVVRSILPGGSCHLKFIHWMKRLSTFLQSLRGADGQAVPVIFRPWHENNGSWFWWGQRLCSDSEFHALWCMLQDHLLADGLDNLIWSYSPNVGGFDEQFFLTRYPGDDRVDLIGLDAYQQPNGEESFIRQINNDLRVLCSYAQRANRLVALTECGYQNIPDPSWWTRVLKPQIQQYPILYFLVWRNADKRQFFGPAPGMANTPDFLRMIKDKRILMLKDLK